jgi:hypothetical protein
VIKQATLAQTGAASCTVEFVAVANVVPALTALYGSIDELKHRDASLSISRAKRSTKRLMRFVYTRLSTIALTPAMKKSVARKFFLGCRHFQTKQFPGVAKRPRL